MKKGHKYLNQNQVSLALFKKYSKTLSVLLSIAILNLSVSCAYYTVKDLPNTKETVKQTVTQFNEQDKYAIFHMDSFQWHLKDMVVDEDNQTISGTVVPLFPEHVFDKRLITKPDFAINEGQMGVKQVDTSSKKHKTRDSKRVHRYSKYNKPLNEVHFYLNNNRNYETNQNVTIPFSDIDRISINDPNTGRTIANIFAGTFGTIAFAVLLVVALKSSCPFVYIKNGDEFYFAGELYPGTITANMQKDDYLSLPGISEDNGNYSIKIANHLKEIQHTDVVQLIRYAHSEGIEVLLDQQGNPHTFKNVVEPIQATLDDGSNYIQPSLAKDNDFYMFNTTLNTKNSTRHVFFEFNRPVNSQNAKLYLTAKNSVWLDYMFGKFNEQFGSFYNTFQKKQQKVSKESIENWVKGQNIPLSVYVKTNDVWRLVEKINTVGPMATRDIAVSIPLEGLDSETLQIKLETGFMFWEVDYIGIDYSENVELTAAYLSPTSVIDQNGNEVVDLLKHKDSKYLVQPNIGDEVIVSFQSKSNDTEAKSSLFLKSRGYYNYIRNYKGVPDFERLKEFKEDHVFTKYSEQYYFDIVNFNSKKVSYHE